MDDYSDQDTWYEIQGKYAQGWETLTTTDARLEAYDLLTDYDQNEPDIKHRVRRRRGQGWNGL
jgi:hypothetical protein